MIASGMNLVSTIIGFGMSATFIVFVCTRIICGRIRGAESRQMFIESRIDHEQPEHRITGLEPVLVAAIPTMMFCHEAFGSVEDAQCSICLGEYQEREVLRIMPQCGHNFHLTCIDVWLRKQSTCPVCRYPVQGETKYTRQTRIGVVQPADSPQTAGEHSRLWLLPGHERSGRNSSDQIHPDDTISSTQELPPPAIA